MNQKKKKNIDTTPYFNTAQLRLKNSWEKDMSNIKKFFLGFPETTNKDRMWFDAGFYEGALYIIDKLEKNVKDD